MKIFQKSSFCFIFTIVFSTAYAHILYAKSTGPEAYRTGAPVDFGTCKIQGCHNSFPLNSGDAKFSISTIPAFYTPGKTIKVIVSFQNGIGKRHGFEITALNADLKPKRVGKFISIDSYTQVIPPGDDRGLELKDKGKYLEHTLAGAQKRTPIWKFKWKAPLKATGPITFYAAGNDANGNGKPSGDHIYTTQLPINATSTASVQ